MIKQKMHSFRTKLIFMLIFQLILLVTILTSYTIFLYINTAKSSKTANENFIALYGKDLDLKIKDAQNVLEQIVYDNADYVLLQSPSESERYYASRRLFLLVNEKLSFDKNVDLLIIAENSYEQCIASDNLKLGYNEIAELKNFVLEQSGNKELKSQWLIKKSAGHTFLYKMYGWQGRAACVLLDADKFLSNTSYYDFSDLRIRLVDDANEDIVFLGEEKAFTPTESYVYEISDTNLSLLLDVRLNSFVKSFTLNGIGVLLIILISLISGIILFKSVSFHIIHPVSDMGENMKQIQNGDYEHKVTTDYPNREFEGLKDTFNKLMDEIENLRIERYEEQLELEQSELKAIKLQIRPHFFLNALTSISNLSQQHKNDEIVSYINILSKNIRYMFKSGMHTVDLRQELDHLDSYFEMQKLKYPDCVFNMVTAEEGLDNYQIPQMLLHTVIENEYKYAVVMGQVLSIFINIKKIELNGRQYLCIEIEDDGDGYPQEFIDGFSKEQRPEEDGTRIGLWGLKKMLYLMYNESDLFTIKNIEPHGCYNKFLIPEKTVHEIRKH